MDDASEACAPWSAPVVSRKEASRWRRCTLLACWSEVTKAVRLSTWTEFSLVSPGVRVLCTVRPGADISDQTKRHTRTRDSRETPLQGHSVRSGPPCIPVSISLDSLSLSDVSIRQETTKKCVLSAELCN